MKAKSVPAWWVKEALTLLGEAYKNSTETGASEGIQRPAGGKDTKEGLDNSWEMKSDFSFYRSLVLENIKRNEQGPEA